MLAQIGTFVPAARPIPKACKLAKLKTFLLLEHTGPSSIHADQGNNVHVTSASCFQDMSAGQDDKLTVTGPSDSVEHPCWAR